MSLKYKFYNTPRQKGIVELSIRIFVSVWTIAYGLGKVLKAQFTYDGETLLKPVKDLSGFELTWIYFGYSYPYVIILGCIQIIGSFLFLFNKTKLIGGFILMPIYANIIVIDILYGIPTGALVNAVAYFLGTCIVLIMNGRRILDALVYNIPKSGLVKGSYDVIIACLIFIMLQVVVSVIQVILGTTNE